MINFNVPPFTGKEYDYIKQAVEAQKICGDGEFTRLCSEKLCELAGAPSALLTTSCTHALELAAMLCDIKEGDEVIMPSFTFVSTADAFVLRGAKAVFVDIRPDTMNIDETLVEAAVTERTRAVAPVHYAGVACEMDVINDIAKRRGLFVVEDAAQGVNATYKGRALGALGDFGCYSFHETKNLSCGEGGALLMRDEKYRERAEIIREKGTDRSKFFRGQIDKYTWQAAGSSYLPSELCAAYLWAQLELVDEITADRLKTWGLYREGLDDLARQGRIELPTIPPDCRHNGHMFYIKCADLAERTALLKHLKDNGILGVFHYIPLHSSPAGLKLGRFCGEDVYTTRESERLVRLPLYYKLPESDVEYIISKVEEFYASRAAL